MEIGPLPRGKQRKRAHKQPSTSIKHYRQTHVYIFDDMAPDAVSQPTMGQRSHQRSCHLIRTFFQTSVKCNAVHSVSHQANGFTGEKFIAWWEKELDKYKKSDLVVVYFEGHAYGRGITYAFKFHSKPRKVNAHQLFEATNKHRPDCLWILECPFPTRFLDVPHRARGSSDYTIAGQNLELGDNETQREPWDYTFQIAAFLPRFVKEIKTTFKRWHDRVSIPEIMAVDKRLCSNPLRMWDRRTHAGSEENVYRMCIEPETIRQTGQMHFIRVRIQGPDKPSRRPGLPRDNDNSDSEDDDDDNDDDDPNDREDSQDTSIKLEDTDEDAQSLADNMEPEPQQPDIDMDIEFQLPEEDADMFKAEHMMDEEQSLFVQQ